MSRIQQTERRWVSYVENAVRIGITTTTIPHHYLALENAVSLAKWLNVTLKLTDDKYVFTLPEKAAVVARCPSHP